MGGEDAGPAGGKSRLAGRYRLEEQLSGQDGSVVWQATDEVLARRVTVRLFTPGFARAGEVVAAARAASRLTDVRLVQIFDADDRAERPFIVTEWPPGTRLDHLLATGPLGPLRAAQIIAAAADAIASAHAAGLAHQRLKPDSLWCSQCGEVKISGLGIAAALAGVQEADPALADTRGLARLLYAALTGHWPGTDQTTLPAAPRCGGRACRPGQLRAGIPRDIDAVTWRALLGEAASDRPPILGPAQLAAELAAIAHPGQPPLIPAAALTQPLIPAAAPAAALTAVTAATPVTPVLPLPPVPAAPQACPLPWTVTTAGQSPRPAGRPAAPAKPARKRTAKVLLSAAVMLVLAAVTAGGWLLARDLTARHGSAIAGARGRPAATAGTLTPVSAVAFDPYGNGQGENNQLAPLAIDANPTTAWHTDWYTTASFGNLKPGTGLLLDMGRPVTITSARITLRATPGAGFQLRVGATAASLTVSRPVARVANAGGQVSLRLTTPAHGRYVLIWFTRLPPDPSGTFQANVYDVSLHGTA